MCLGCRLHPSPPVRAEALRGLKVIDVPRIKVELSDGDDTRTWALSFLTGVASCYLGLNRNKRGMHFDLSTEDGGRAADE